VAPAGWGKTTLLSQWANDPDEVRRIAWVSLDPSDDEPTRFWTYLLTALGQHGVGGDALEALGAPGLEPVDVALPLLLNEAKTMSDPVLVVLDDYHVLTDPRIHEGVEFLLAYLPPTLRLITAGRTDPPLPLPRLRARGELTEIRMTDLGFSEFEAGDLLESVAATDLDPAAVAALVERTEGWAAGLQLAALTIKGRSAASSAVDAIRGDDRHILDFFASEVISKLGSDQRDLLVRTSVLERLSGALCDAVLDRTGSAALLADLDQSNLFVVPLDNRREWYRCHRLFRDALQHQLPSEASTVVLARAADWFYARGFLDDAIALRIEAGEPREAADLLRRAVPWFLEHGAGAIVGLGDRLGVETVGVDPGLCASLGWAAAVAGKFDQVGPWLDAAESAATDEAEPPQAWHSLTGAVSALRAVPTMVNSRIPEAIRLAELGVRAETDEAQPGYVLARHILGTAYLVDERPADAIPILEDAWQRARERRFAPSLTLQPACTLALALFQTERYGEARRVCDQSAAAMQAVERAWGDAAALGIGRLVMIQGRLSLRDGDVAEAQRLARRAVVLARIWAMPSQIVMALGSLAEVELVAGDLPAARSAIAAARELIDTEPIWPFVQRDLADVDVRVGRGAARKARRPGAVFLPGGTPPEPPGVLFLPGGTPPETPGVFEQLTDRELSILRMLPGTASQREIGSALFLSINTVKGYAKSLYRKLDVTTRQEAVERGRALNLI
jgi:LuxR family maltose regulon positive regulatory protein